MVSGLCRRLADELAWLVCHHIRQIQDHGVFDIPDALFHGGYPRLGIIMRLKAVMMAENGGSSGSNWTDDGLLLDWWGLAGNREKEKGVE